MSKIIFVVGPSRAGKSTLSNKMSSSDKRFLHKNLDEIMRLDIGVERADQLPSVLNGWGPFWEKAKDTIDHLESEFSDSEKIILLDIGAGGLQTQEGRRFFVDHADQLVCVWTSPEALLRRHPGRGSENLLHTEFSSERKQVYDAAKFRIDTTNNTVEEAFSEFNYAVQTLAQASSK
jgi:guanylate kinase